MAIRILSGRSFGKTRRLVGTAALAIQVTACQSFLDNLLEADAPGTVRDETLEIPTNAPLLVASIQTDLYCALADYTVVSGLVGNELAWAENNTFDYDRRTFNASTGDRNYATTPCGTSTGNLGLGVYTPLSTARWSGEHAHGVLEAFADADVPGGLRATYLATATIHSAYATLVLGEAMCEASINLGPRLSRRQILEAAEQRFTTGLAEAQTANNQNLLSLARVGRARTRLNLATNPSQYGGPVAGKGADAVADAQAVPAGFAYNAGYATTDTRSSNKVWWWINDQIRATVDPAYWNLAFQGAPDRRVQLIYTGRNGMDGITPLVQQTKYPLRNSPIPLGRYTEAQLIIAEVQGGQVAVNIINALHTAVQLPPFNSTDATVIRNQVIQERQRELFLESQHLGDQIRFNLPFLPPAGTPYKLNAGGNYGSATCFPFPDEERLNNPNTSGQ